MTYDITAWRNSNTNGNIDRKKLREIDPVQYDPDLEGPGIMHPDAARAMTAMLYDAKAAGHGDLHSKYSYRTLADQQTKWRAYLARGRTPPIVAFPGTSNHGWAVTSDLTWSTGAAITWAHANCAKYGFKFDVPSENWHCTYQPGEIRPAVLVAEDSMSAEEIERGFKAYREDKEPAQDGLARLVYRVLKDTASKPGAGTPGPHSHEGTVKVT